MAPASVPSDDPFATSSAGEDPFWFQSAGELLGNGPTPPAAPGPERAPDPAPAPELEGNTPELELATAPRAAEGAPPPAAPAAPSGLELAWPEPASTSSPLALEDAPSKTGARPLDAGALDFGFGSTADGWDLSPSTDEPPGDPAAGDAAFGTEGSLDSIGAGGAASHGAPELPSGAAASQPPGPTAQGQGSPAAVATAPARPSAAAVAPAPAPAAPPRRGLRAFMPDSLWLALLVALAIGIVLGWRGHLASRLRAAMGGGGAAALEIGGVRGGLYDTSSGAPALVVRGEVVARAAVEGPVGVRVELLEGSRVVATGEALAGAAVTPEEVFAATDVDQAAALRRALDARARSGLEAGGRAPFAVVFPPPAPDPHGIELRVTAEPARPAGR